MDQKDVIENLKIAIIYGRDIVDGEYSSIYFR